MSGRIKIKSKDKDKKPKIDVFKVIENRFKNMNELRDLIDMDPRKGLARIRDGPALGRWSVADACIGTTLICWRRSWERSCQ